MKTFCELQDELAWILQNLLEEWQRKCAARRSESVLVQGNPRHFCKSMVQQTTWTKTLCFQKKWITRVMYEGKKLKEVRNSPDVQMQLALYGFCYSCDTIRTWAEDYLLTSAFSLLFSALSVQGAWNKTGVWRPSCLKHTHYSRYQSLGSVPKNNTSHKCFLS